MSERGKSPGDDNIPAELIKNGGEAMLSTFTSICNKIWETRECTISLISHPSKVMLKVLLNRLKPQAEEIIAEEQAGLEQAGARLNRYST